MDPLKPGDKVRFTGKYLRSTGQVRSQGEGRGNWTITAIDGDWAVTDALVGVAWFSEAELAEDPTLAFRRINLGNLERVK